MTSLRCAASPSLFAKERITWSQGSSSRGPLAAVQTGILDASQSSLSDVAAAALQEFPRALAHPRTRALHTASLPGMVATYLSSQRGSVTLNPSSQTIRAANIPRLPGRQGLLTTEYPPTHCPSRRFNILCGLQLMLSTGRHSES